MKLSITEEFLCDLYNILEKADDIADFLLNHRAIKFMPGPKNPIFEKYRHDKNRKNFRKLLHYAKKRGYIKIKNLKGNIAIMLTKNGLDKVLKASCKIDQGVERKDGKWIMLIFDIPVRHKKARSLMSSVLKNLRYQLLQQSVWVTPYDIYEKTEKLLRLYALDKYVKIFLIEKV